MFTVLRSTATKVGPLLAPKARAPSVIGKRSNCSVLFSSKRQLELRWTWTWTSHVTENLLPDTHSELI